MNNLALLVFFFFNDTATTEIYTLSLHDALPIYALVSRPRCCRLRREGVRRGRPPRPRTPRDRKSTRLNSSHSQISYAVFCLKKKKQSILPCQRRPTLPPNQAYRRSEGTTPGAPP